MKFPFVLWKIIPILFFFDGQKKSDKQQGKGVKRVKSKRKKDKKNPLEHDNRF